MRKPIYHNSLDLNRVMRGATVYGRHPLTGEKFPAERYTYQSHSESAADGCAVRLVDASGKAVESSPTFLCQ